MERKLWSRRLPSPAVVISGIALTLAIGGGTVAIATSDNHQDRKIAKAVVTKEARLHVKSAKLLNGWQAGASPGYAKDSSGIVRLFGYVSRDSDSTTTIFKLPRVYRPSSFVDVPVAVFSGNVGAISIEANGEVHPVGTPQRFVDLEGVTFAAGR
jgi:hypothetical protein